MKVVATTLADRERWLSRKDVARRMGLTENRVSQLTREGVLMPVETSIGRLYDRDAVDRLIAERVLREKPDEPAQA